MKYTAEGEPKGDPFVSMIHRWMPRTPEPGQLAEWQSNLSQLSRVYREFRILPLAFATIVRVEYMDALGSPQQRYILLDQNYMMHMMKEPSYAESHVMNKQQLQSCLNMDSAIRNRAVLSVPTGHYPFDEVAKQAINQAGRIPRAIAEQCIKKERLPREWNN